MKETSGSINMKAKKYILSLLVIPALASCNAQGASFKAVKDRVDTMGLIDEYPYYRVRGMLDFDNELLEIDETFSENPDIAGRKFVAHARYNEGFYNSTLDGSNTDPVIYGMSSRSYWFRVPLRISKSNFYQTIADNKGSGSFDKSNFDVTYNTGVITDFGKYSNCSIEQIDDNSLRFQYTEEEIEHDIVLIRQTEFDESAWFNGTWENDEHKMVLHQSKTEDTTCAHSIIEHVITSYMDIAGSANPSKNYMKYRLTSSGGVVFYGDRIHTKVRLDNYPYYPDPAVHPEIGDWDEDDPLPCYYSIVNFKGDISFEYDKDGWLISERASSIGYNYINATKGQFAAVASYSYKFE